jgi:choline dehydrogenase
MDDMLPSDSPEFADHAASNQRIRANDLQKSYDFVVCGAGTSGSVVARRLAEYPFATVLLIEAGGSDDLPSIREPGAWPANLGSNTGWGFAAEPNPHANGRSIPMSMARCWEADQAST